MQFGVATRRLRVCIAVAERSSERVPPNAAIRAAGFSVSNRGFHFTADSNSNSNLGFGFGLGFGTSRIRREGIPLPLGRRRSRELPAFGLGPPRLDCCSGRIQLDGIRRNKRSFFGGHNYLKSLCLCESFVY